MKLKLTDGRYELLDANNRPLPDAKLSLSNCHAIALGYDLEELAANYAAAKDIDIPYQNGLFYGFKAGFQKALEMFGDKKFTKDDIMIAWDAGVMSNSICTTTYFGLKRDEQLKRHRESYRPDLIKTSLNEWNVYIEQEPHNDFVDDGNTHIISARPKLDATGCLILKRI